MGNPELPVELECGLWIRVRANVRARLELGKPDVGLGVEVNPKVRIWAYIKFRVTFGD